MSQQRDKAMARMSLVGALLGTLTEWYDFALYGYMATVLSHVFFPDETDPALAILGTLAIYGVAFAARPIGAMYLGSLGDRVGRRTSLAIIVTGMGLATLLTGFLPSYATVGVVAPICLVCLRLFQGFFAGGEQTGASSLISEWAPRNRRALWTCLSPTASAVSFLLAVGVVLATESAVPTGAWESWGWRIPFIFGGGISMIGLYIRLKLDDSPVFEELEQEDAVEASPLRTVIHGHWRHLLAVAAGVGIYGVLYYSLATPEKGPLRWVGLMKFVGKECNRAERGIVYSTENRREMAHEPQTQRFDVYCSGCIASRTHAAACRSGGRYGTQLRSPRHDGSNLFVRPQRGQTDLHELSQVQGESRHRVRMGRRPRRTDLRDSELLHVG